MLGVEPVDHHLVHAEIAKQCEAIVRRERDVVGVGSLLTLRVDAFAFVLDEVGGLAELAVGADGNDDDAAAVVVGGEDEAAG